MKKIKVTWVPVVAVAVATLALGSIYAGTASQSAVVAKAIANAPVSELAARAAKLVVQTSASEREQMAVATVEVIVKQHPAVATTVVAAICKTAPETAAKVAAKAAALNPDQATAIARAAALAAPQYAAKIAAAVATVVPKYAVQVAEVIIMAVPSASTATAEAVAAVSPIAASSLKPVLRLGSSAATPLAAVITQNNSPINPNAPSYSSRGPAFSATGLDTPGADYSRP